MSIYAEFYRNKGDEYAACGDRAVLKLDGRERVASWHSYARAWAIKHNWGAYRLIHGDSLLRAMPLTRQYGLDEPYGY